MDIIAGEFAEEEKTVKPAIFEAHSTMKKLMLDMKVYKPLAKFTSTLGNVWRFGDMIVRVCVAYIQKEEEEADQADEWAGEGLMLLQMELSHTATSSDQELKEAVLNEQFKHLGSFFVKDSLRRKYPEFNSREDILHFYKRLGLSCRHYSEKHKAAHFIYFYKKLSSLRK